MPNNTVDRSIYYYDFYAMKKNSENETYKRDVTGKTICTFFDRLKKNQDVKKNYKDSMISIGESENLFVIVDSITQKEVYFRLILCRKDALPYVEKAGVLETLDTYIGNDQNIAEITHCIFFKNYGIIGAEYNFSGARAGAIANYMTNKSKNSIFFCRPKLNMDSYSKLIDGEEFSLFQLAVKSNSDAYNKVLEKKSIFSAMLATVPEADVFEVTIKKRKLKKNEYAGFDLPLDNPEIKELLTNYRDDLTKFNVSQGAMKDSIDLLADKFVNKVTIIKTANRTIDRDDINREIRNFFYSDVEGYC